MLFSQHKKLDDGVEIRIRGRSVQIEEEARRKIFGIASLLSGEVSGLAFAKIVKGVPVIYNPELLKQESSAARTELDQEGVALFIEKLMLDGHDEEIGNIKVWWHSHGTMSCYWSDQDEATIKKLMETAPWLISLVVNQAGEYRCRMDIADPWRVSIDALQLVSAQNEDAAFLEGLQAEIDEKVSQPFSKPIMFGGDLGHLSPLSQAAFGLARENPHHLDGPAMGDLRHIISQQADSFRFKIEDKVAALRPETLCTIPNPKFPNEPSRGVRLHASSVRKVLSEFNVREGHPYPGDPDFVIEGDPDEGAPVEEIETEDGLLFAVAVEPEFPENEVPAECIRFLANVWEAAETIVDTINSIRAAVDGEVEPGEDEYLDEGTDPELVSVRLVRTGEAEWVHGKYQLGTWVTALEQLADCEGDLDKVRKLFEGSSQGSMGFEGDLKQICTNPDHLNNPDNEEAQHCSLHHDFEGKDQQNQLLS